MRVDMFKKSIGYDFNPTVLSSYIYVEGSLNIFTIGWRHLYIHPVIA